MQIELGKYYRLKNGGKIEIVLVTNMSKEKYPFKGVFLGEEEAWAIENGRTSCDYWSSDGKIYVGRGCGELDIVGKWEEPGVTVDWSKFPSHIKYLAMDECGTWYGHTAKPKLESGLDWAANYDMTWRVRKEDEPKGDIDWKYSLLEREENKESNHCCNCAK